MEPLISIRLEGSRQNYQPGQELECHYQIDAVVPQQIQSVEASVLWYTEGKGDADMAVHFFERRVPGSTEVGSLLEMRSLRTKLPNSPLSYEGIILKLRWAVRVRLFLRNGKQFVGQVPFRLGDVPASRAVEPPVVEEDEEQTA